MIAVSTSSPLLLGFGDRLQHPLEVARHHLGEVLQLVLPIGEDPLPHGRIRRVDVRLDHLVQPFDIGFVECVQVDHLRVEVLFERAVRVVDVRHTARHARREVAPGRPEDDDLAAGHVFAAVVADALDDGVRARVAHREPLADHAAKEGLAAGRAEQDHVARDDVVLGDVVAGASSDGRTTIRPPDRPLPT